MKKSILKSIIIALSTMMILSGCASIPEPSEKNDNLLYGNIAFNFTCAPNNWGIPEGNQRTDNIEIKFQNVKTKRIISMRSNSKGEFFKAGIPAGTYRIYSFSKTIKTQYGFEDNYEVKFNPNKANSLYFISVANCVINLGKIDIDINIPSVGTQYTWYYRYNWDKEFDETYYLMSVEHTESGWLDKDWLTRAETLE